MTAWRKEEDEDEGRHCQGKIEAKKLARKVSQ